MIKDQRLAADIILSKLQLLDPNCILAGGAPRDWYMKKEANDLDFYIYLNPKNQVEKNTRQVEDVLALIGILDLENISYESMTDEKGAYSCMEHLRTVYEGNYEMGTDDFIKVQIMVMYSPTFDCVVDKMGCSLSRIWYKNGKITPTFDFLFTLEHKIMYYVDDMTFKETYAIKMKDRFKDYRFKPYKSFEKDYERVSIQYYMAFLTNGITGG